MLNADSIRAELLARYNLQRAHDKQKPVLELARQVRLLCDILVRETNVAIADLVSERKPPTTIEPPFVTEQSQ